MLGKRNPYRINPNARGVMEKRMMKRWTIPRMKRRCSGSTFSVSGSGTAPTDPNPIVDSGEEGTIGGSLSAAALSIAMGTPFIFKPKTKSSTWTAGT